jgi:hypothetical protein
MRRVAASIALLATMVAACTGGPAPVVTQPLTPTASPPTESLPTPPPAASEGQATAAPPTGAPPTEAPPTEAPATEPPVVGTPAPSGSPTPSVDTFKAAHTASCSSDNGTGTVGQVRLTWTTTGTTGVRISIDPPSPDQAYGYGYDDYPMPSGFADVPFACGAPNHDATGAYHLYVAFTLHDKGYAAYRYVKIYEVTSP